jgi:hypothetical protein
LPTITNTFLTMLFPTKTGRSYLDRQWEKQASYIEPAIDSVRNVWKEFKAPTAPVEPGVRERDDFERWRQQIYHSRSNQDEFECFVNASYSVIFLLLYIHGLTFSLIKIKAEPVSIGSSSALGGFKSRGKKASHPYRNWLSTSLLFLQCLWNQNGIFRCPDTTETYFYKNPLSFSSPTMYLPYREPARINSMSR